MCADAADCDCLHQEAALDTMRGRQEEDFMRLP